MHPTLHKLPQLRPGVYRSGPHSGRGRPARRLRVNRNRAPDGHVSRRGCGTVAAMSADSADTAATVVVADDHAVVRAGVRMLLGADGRCRIVGEAAGVAETLAAVRAHQPDLLLLDINMPDGAALDRLAEIRAASPDTRVIVLTMEESAGYARRSLRAGASGYVLKEALGEELVAAVRAVLGGRTYVDPALAAGLLQADDDPLTAREREILRLLALGWTNQQIAEHLHYSLRTVEGHRARVRAKLEISDRAGLVAEARTRGLLDGHD